MSLETRARLQDDPAHVTLVLRLNKVALHVPLHVALPHIRFPAFRTLVRSFPGVYFRVLLQEERLVEAFITHVAGVRSLPRV